MIVTLFAFLMPAIAMASFSYNLPEKNQTSYYYSSSPGSVIDDFITIKNLDSAPVTLSFYGADALQTVQGDFAAKTIQDEQVAMGKWIKFKDPTTELQGMESKQVPFQITLPANVTPGTYPGALAISSVVSKAPTQGMGMKVATRMIVKVLVDLPGTVKYDYSWDSYNYAPDRNNNNTFSLSFPITAIPALPLTARPAFSVPRTAMTRPCDRHGKSKPRKR
jgi:hypothetical protein